MKKALKNVALLVVATTAMLAPAAQANAIPYNSGDPIKPRMTSTVNGQANSLSPQQRNLAHVTSRQARDMVGVESSTYTGKYYRSSLENKRRCIVDRESSGYYSVRGGGGNNYFGAYQMSPELARGATWMMLPEHKKLLGEKEAKRILTKLRSTPPNKWNRYWQDAAFSTIANWDGTGSGLHHWAGGRWTC